ncbi:MAG: chromosome segregation protein SMC [Bacilli bacterium]|jgi:chromosome segregation protein|nr:chromosome segregation protein SMC [Bacilli bacterium]
MYLKKVEALGFKSFANKVSIDFTPQINGIVGPNGCGKSNVVDAIKWVLGEQSTKNLRAQGMVDVIFSGSQDYKKQNMAEVTLTFDNSDQALNIAYEEVAITRRLYRSGDSEYYINKSKVRLKDIVDLIMDTSLGKDSLAMISQGGISNFANAKPIERRHIFEEAAGVSKYKKRKIESLRKLERVNENLLRINDIVFEISTQLQPLKNQADKTKIYLERKEKLEKIEASVIVFEVNGFEEELKKINTSLLTLESELVLNENSLLNEENKLVTFKKQLASYDENIASLQDCLLKKVEEISTLEKQKNQQDQNKNELIINDIDKIKSNLDLLDNEINTININIKSLNEDLVLIQQDYTMQKEQYHNKQQVIINNQQRLHAYQSKKDVLENIMNNQSNLFEGVKAVLDARNSLTGVIGIVNDLFNVEELYQNAISISLGPSLQNIVMNDNDDIKRAITYLKNNQAGRATFIPLDSIKPKNIKDEDLFVAQNIKGFIDIGTNLISFNEEYQPVFAYLLNNTLITEDFDSALQVSKALNRKYKIVSIDGEVINPGGIVTGGKRRKEKGNILTIKKDVLKLEEEITKLNNNIASEQNELLSIDLRVNELRNKVNQQNVSIVKLEQDLSHKRTAFENNKNDYFKLTNTDYNNENTLLNDIDYLLQASLLEKENILASLKSFRESYLEINKEINRVDKDNKSMQLDINEIKQELNNLKITKNTLEMKIANNLERLAQEYQLTIDNAREKMIIELDCVLAKKEVDQLKREIAKLGPINLLAVEEFDKLNERYEFLLTQQTDLTNAKDELLATINETDKIMVHKFKKTIEDINQELPITFKKLFGGGSATLEYTDPSNILETGIEIIATPPGKSIQNLSLFSGGEKALIALSVLFAILKARPIPLSILDEVEAALDQANVQRFAKFLKEFNASTQFIVITHRPGTMEECDVLYGITMQEKGVSKMISVKLEEAKDLIA